MDVCLSFLYLMPKIEIKWYNLSTQDYNHWSVKIMICEPDNPVSMK